MAGDLTYKGKVNFLLCNLASLEDGDKFAAAKGLAGNAIACTGSPPAEYGLQYIPHKVLIDAQGNVVKNFKMDLPGDLDLLLQEQKKYKRQEVEAIYLPDLLDCWNQSWCYIVGISLGVQYGLSEQRARDAC